MRVEELYSRYLECGGRVNTDSRTIAPGEMFVALKGDNFDGNAFALQALDKGARYAVVNADSEAARSGREGVMAAADTLDTLRELAAYHRLHCAGDRHIPVIGLTGTNGKTTTKELLRAVLSRKYKVHATEGNLNNDIGVPQTLLKMKKDTEIAIVEMGANHPDDIARLVEVSRPDFGLITNVGKAHLLGFGSFEGVCRAKGQLYDFLRDNGGKAFFNSSDSILAEMVSERKGLEVLPYSAESMDARILPGDASNPFLAMTAGGRLLQTALVGTYNAANVLAALAIGAYFGVPQDEAMEAVASYKPSNNRSQMVRTENNTLIVDAYNANPSSMSVALDNFASIRSDKKLALIGDMRELGGDSLKEHMDIVRKVTDGDYDAIFVGREFSAAIRECGASYPVFDSSGMLADFLHGHPVTGTLVLVKGSRGIQMEKVIPQL